MASGLRINCSGRWAVARNAPFKAALPTGWRGVCLAQQQAERVRSNNAGSSKQPDDDEFDTGALLKYVGAVPTQVAIMSGALWGLQQAADAITAAESLPGGVAGADAARYLVTLFFLVTSLKSRIFSPLPANRPTLSSEGQAKAANLRPWWCPPPIAFPIGWTLVALLRTITSVMVWEASGRDTLAAPIIVMMLQLSCGDCWNFIRNVENRVGVATTGMIINVSVFYATVWAYYLADPTAGQLLAPTALWITFASTIVWGTWDLSGRPPLYPTKGESRKAAA